MESYLQIQRLAEQYDSSAQPELNVQHRSAEELSMGGFCHPMLAYYMSQVKAERIANQLLSKYLTAVCYDNKSQNNSKQKINNSKTSCQFIISNSQRNMDDQKNQKIFRKQPISCPWITSQPYHSAFSNKNRCPTNQSDPSLANRFLNNPWVNRQMPIGLARIQDKTMPSIQQSSSQFFYFLRLMQLFPDTHPATLHTVLTLCKNDFFCAVDKLLYAKKCKIVCNKRNLSQKLSSAQSRSRNVCNYTTALSSELLQNISRNETCIMRKLNKDKTFEVGNYIAATATSVNEEGVKMDETPGCSKKETVVNNLQPGPSSETIVINLFSDNAEDLTVIKCDDL